MNAQNNKRIVGKRFVYICAPARSGSTILDMFLGGHPRIRSLGELNMIGKALALNQECTCLTPLRKCPAWAEVFSVIREQYGIDFIKAPYDFRLWDARAVAKVDRRHQTKIFEMNAWLRRVWLRARVELPPEWRGPLPAPLERAIANKSRLYDAVCNSWNCDVVVDSSKNYWEAIELSRRWPEQVLVLLLVRDGRGVYHSRRKSGRSRAESLHGWRVFAERTMPLLVRNVPEQCLVRLRYEELASDPAMIGESLVRRIGLTFDAAMLDLSSAERHMVNGNETRFSPGKGIRLDERWRDGLVGEELEFFERTAGALNRQLGYN